MSLPTWSAASWGRAPLFFKEERVAEVIGRGMANLDGPTLAAIELFLAGAMPQAA